MNLPIAETNKPWRDTEGALLSDTELKKISKTWDADTWERFLVETVEGSSSYQREELISPYAYDRALEEMHESVWGCAEFAESDDDFNQLVRRACRDHLSAHQQHIIRLIYWEGLSERAVADVKGVSRSSVAVQKRRSLSKLKRLLEARASNFPRYEGVLNLKSSSQKGSRYADLHDVYLEEISEIQTPFGGR